MMKTKAILRCVTCGITIRLKAVTDKFVNAMKDDFDSQHKTCETQCEMTNIAGVAEIAVQGRGQSVTHNDPRPMEKL